MASHFHVSISKISRIMQKYDIYAKTPKRKRFTKPWDKNLPNMWVANIKKELVWYKVWMHHEKELVIWTLDQWIIKKWLSPEISHTDQWIEAVYLQIYYYNNNRIYTALKMSPVQFANSH